MRKATQSLIGQGPKAATAAIQQALRGIKEAPDAAPKAEAHVMRDINPPPAGGAAPQPGPKPESARPEPQRQAPPEAGAKAPAPPFVGGFESPFQNQAASKMRERGAALKDLVPELMAGLDRLGTEGLSGFKMPSFELPGGGSASAGPALPGKFIDASFSNSAGTRSYKLYVPSTYTGAPTPLVVMLHGCTQNPDDFATGTQMNALAEEMHFLVVYPAQSQQANVSRCWNWFNAADQQRDQGEPSIIAGITRTVADQYAVDRGQVYVAGLSAGGAMATIMGTLYPDLYAAVGVHSGLPFAAAHDLPSAMAAMQGNLARNANMSGNLAAAVPIIVFHGDRDTTVHPANGHELAARGARHAGKAPVVEPGSVPHGHNYTRTVHHREDGSPQAEHWTIHGAGHAWSGGSAHGTYTDGKGPDASREMMRFFKTAR
ncbi:esterase [Massilia glaciei]|uniref:Esterase n=2 Tax=Massilia glaciei TaxID=1524097 RepID=A0A2U2I794_9BURK|nr:esterase [Massilia glaciei]